MENCWGRDTESAEAMQLATELTIIDKVSPSPSQFLSYKYTIALAQMTPSPNEISNQTQQPQQQQWIDKTNNIRILFSNVPAKPIIDSKTQMKFTVQNLTTDENIKDLLHAFIQVTVT
jgi:hypothetical protein